MSLARSLNLAGIYACLNTQPQKGGGLLLTVSLLRHIPVPKPGTVVADHLAKCAAEDAAVREEFGILSTYVQVADTKCGNVRVQINTADDMAMKFFGHGQGWFGC